MIFKVLRLVFAVALLVLVIDGRSQSTNVSEKFDPLFDERERADRDRAFRQSYPIVVGGMMAGAMYASFALGWNWWLPNLRGAIDIAFAVGLISIALPGVILMWRERLDFDELERTGKPGGVGRR